MGDIQLPGYQQAQAQAVLAALQAAHQAYGINTEKGQQQLLAAQTRAAEIANKQTEFENKQYRDWFGDNSEDQSPAAGSSALGNAVKQNKKIPPRVQEYLLKGQQLSNAQTEGQIKKGEAAEQPKKFAMEHQNQINAFQTEFNKDTKDDRERFEIYKQVAKGLTSGNIADVNAADDLLAKTKLRITRINPETGESIEDPTWAAQFRNALSKKTKGTASPQELKGFIDAANSGQMDAANSIMTYANSRASQIGQNLGMDANHVRDKVLLPGGLKPQLIKADVLPDKKTGAAALHVMQPNGSWKPVRMENAGQ